MADMWAAITESESVAAHYANYETKLGHLRNNFASTTAPSSTNLVSGIIFFCKNAGSICHYGWDGNTWQEFYTPT